MIHLRFLDTRKHKNIIKNPTVSKIERKLILLYSQYENTMNYIRTEGNTIAKSLQNLIEKIKINPNKFEINQLKKIKNISKEMWKNIHALSENQLYYHPQILHTVIKISCILSSAEKVFYPLFSSFYNELKTNYLQLEKEILNFSQLKKNDPFKVKDKLRKVKLLE
jgi:hypothetical protein